MYVLAFEDPEASDLSGSLVRVCHPPYYRPLTLSLSLPLCPSPSPSLPSACVPLPPPLSPLIFSHAFRFISFRFVLLCFALLRFVPCGFLLVFFYGYVLGGGALGCLHYIFPDRMAGRGIRSSFSPRTQATSSKPPRESHLGRTPREKR